MIMHRHRWNSRTIIDGRMVGAICHCGKERTFPTWRYRIFRLRYVDHHGDDMHWFGVSYYPFPGARKDLGGHRQVGVMLGAREAIFDLRWWWK